jgi:hypothetical protein
MREQIRQDDVALSGALAASVRRGQRYPVPRLYGRAAFAAAVEDGFTPDEVGRVLAGRRVVDAFPVWGGESVSSYAHRAVSEMMMAYVAQDDLAQDFAN